MNVHVDANVPPPDRREIEALAHALHGDPFRVLGPHETSAGSRGARLPARRASRSRCCGARTARVSAGSRRATAACSRAPFPSARRTCCASPGRARVQETEDPYSFGPAARRDRPAPVQRGAALQARRSARRQCDDGRRRARDALRGLGAECRAASPWSAISTPGTRGATRCGCAIRPASGSCSCRASPKACATSSTSSAPAACACRRRPIRSRSRPRCRPPPPRSWQVRSPFRWRDDEWMRTRARAPRAGCAALDLRDASRLVDAAGARRRGARRCGTSRSTG